MKALRERALAWVICLFFIPALGPAELDCPGVNCFGGPGAVCSGTCVNGSETCWILGEGDEACILFDEKCNKLGVVSVEGDNVEITTRDC